MLHMKYCRQRA